MKKTVKRKNRANQSKKYVFGTPESPQALEYQQMLEEMQSKELVVDNEHKYENQAREYIGWENRYLAHMSEVAKPFTTKARKQWEATQKKQKRDLLKIKRTFQKHGITISDPEIYYYIIQAHKMSKSRLAELFAFEKLFYPGLIDPSRPIQQLNGISEIIIVKNSISYTFKESDILQTMSEALNAITRESIENKSNHFYGELLENHESKSKLKQQERAGQLYLTIKNQLALKDKSKICKLIYDLLGIFKLQPMPQDPDTKINNDFKYQRVRRFVEDFLRK